MKKIIILLLISFSLISCSSKTKYENLNKEKKQEIQAYMLSVGLESMRDLLQGKQSQEEMEKNLRKKLEKKFPNIDFGDFKSLEDDDIKLDKKNMGIEIKKGVNMKNLHINNVKID